MADIFGRADDNLGGVMTADQVSVTFGTTGGNNAGNLDIAEAGMLMQSLTLGYSQQFSMIFELNSPKVYYVTGRPTGQASANRIVGVRAIQKVFYEQYGNVCNAKENTLQFSAKGTEFCDQSSNNRNSPGLVAQQQGVQLTYTTKFNVITALQVSVESQRMLVGEQLTLAFGSMKAT